MSTDQDTPSDRFDRVLAHCCRELFSAYGVEIGPAAGDELGPHRTTLLAGVMGFGGPQARGSIVLLCSPGPLAASCPMPNVGQRDWICELSNQLVGRMKIRLRPFGLDIVLGTPSALSSSSLVVTEARPPRLQVFAAASGPLCVWPDYELITDVKPYSVPPEAEPVPCEGELLLF